MGSFTAKWWIVLLVLTAAFVWPTVGMAQTVWEKYPDNPVLDIGPEGAWDSKKVFQGHVLYGGTEYTMWYSGSDGRHKRIGYATSPDGIVWTKYGGNPVLDVGPAEAWDEGFVRDSAVLFAGTEYEMWYSGGGGPRMSIGYATSPDGIVWTKHEGNPVLDVGPSGAWDDLILYTSSVLFDGAGYRMWYGGNDGFNARIGYATSPDGIVWTKYGGNPVLDVGDLGTWDEWDMGGPCVLFDGVGFAMWYAGSDGFRGRIGYATSPDGIDWTKYAGNPVLDVGLPGTGDSQAVIGPSVLFDGTDYDLWLTAYDGIGKSIGYAVSLPGCPDDDGDGSYEESCGGWDCDDSDPAIHPRVEEICDNGIDDNCNGLTDGEDWECIPEYTLAMEPVYESGILSLNFTLGTLVSDAGWASYLIQPTGGGFPLVTQLWEISLPAIYPPIEVSISLPFTTAGELWVYSGLWDEGVPQIEVWEFVEIR